MSMYGKMICAGSIAIAGMATITLIRGVAADASWLLIVILMAIQIIFNQLTIRELERARA